MQKTSGLFCAGIAALALAGCAIGVDDRRGAYDQSYDGYYDGYYGAYNSGYWGSDGYFYYADAQHSYHRDDAHHFHHEQFSGGKPVHGEHHSDMTGDGGHGHDDHNQQPH